MIIVNTHEAKTNLSKLLTLVAEQHETVRICRNGKVMAELVEPKSRDVGPQPLVRYSELDGVVFKESPTEPIPEDFYPDYEEAE